MIIAPNPIFRWLLKCANHSSKVQVRKLSPSLSSIYNPTSNPINSTHRKPLDFLNFCHSHCSTYHIISSLNCCCGSLLSTPIYILSAHIHQLGRHNKTSQAGWLQQQKFIFSWLWRWEVPDQGTNKFVSWWELSSCLANGHLLTCPHVASFLCTGWERTVMSLFF